MATDQSPPRLSIIISIAVVTVVVLVSLKFVFGSYFIDIMEDAAASKLVRPDEVTALHASEAAKLNNSPAVPIDQAMQQLASQGRLGSTLITPQPSDDVGALAGWSHLHDGDQAAGSTGAAAPAMTASAATTTNTPPAPPPGFDGGTSTMSASDAGAMKTGTDAGAPKPHASTAVTDAGAPH